MPTQNNHSGQDMQQWPISHTKSGEQIDTCSEAAKAQADKCSKTLAPLYAGQPVAMYDTLQKIWVPATVIHVLPWNSYQVCTSNGSTYCCIQRHLCECSVKVVNTVASGTTATLQVSDSTMLLSSTTCTAYAAYTHCTCNTSNPDEPSPSCPLIMPAVQKMPWHQCLWHPMPHLCSNEDLAMPAWHLDAQSRKSENSQPILSMDLVSVMRCHPHPQSFIELNHYIPYSLKGGCCMIVSYCLVLRTDPLISWLQFCSTYINRFSHLSSGVPYSKDYVDMFQYLINVFQVYKPEWRTSSFHNSNQ